MSDTDALAAFIADAAPPTGEVTAAELYVDGHTLVKGFALAPGAQVRPHTHDASTNVFHVVRGTVTVVQDGEATVQSAPAVVVTPPGVPHGLVNDTDAPAVVTATFAPPP
jgi:quercetin dioxygenase-like cupin family protein